MPSISVSQTENFHYLKFFLWLLSSLGKLQLWLNFVYGVIPFLPDRLKKKKPNLLGKYTLKLEGKAKDMFTEIRFSSGMGKASLRHTQKKEKLHLTYGLPLYIRQATLRNCFTVPHIGPCRVFSDEKKS